MATTVIPSEPRLGLENPTGLRIQRRFTREGIHPYDMFEWEIRTAHVHSKTGPALQEDVEFPKQWSQTASNIVADKYFYGKLGTPERERSVKQLFDRVVDTIADFLWQESYFATSSDRDAFSDELKYALVAQLVSFNSPVWFNIGVKGVRRQHSACFILSVEDEMESILNWFTVEGRIFKRGSGSGINVSTLRSSHEQLSGGGVASGPVSFMAGADSVAGSIKSGGTTRRAAKMVVLNADHPDIREFIWCKAEEEKKARALRESGIDMSFSSKHWRSVQYQNANNSVRATDAFMELAKQVDEQALDWPLIGVHDKTYVEMVSARGILREIAQATWECGDPGMQFDTTINRWHTCPNYGRINGSNPCSEYMHVDDSSCNLASLNLLRFLNELDIFDVDAFNHVVQLTFTAQDALIGYGEYPTEKIALNSRNMRQIGLGYANLGALLMANGLPYDSDEGRKIAAALTAIMTGEAYAQSARLAQAVGPYYEYDRGTKNKEHHDRVMHMHREEAYKLEGEPSYLVTAAQKSWDEACRLGITEGHGYRNAQATVLAPTGTISFMMDCDTTGVEPDIALIKEKELVGGTSIIIFNQTLPRALQKLGYTETQVQTITAYVQKNGTIEGAPEFQEKDLPVFDCANKAVKGTRTIPWQGHVDMMAAVQPFISGAISKTVNLPEEATVDDIMAAYTYAWKKGIKAIAIYRDGSKNVQPVKTKSGDAAPTWIPGQRRHLPSTRRSQTHKVEIRTQQGLVLKLYIIVGFFEDGSLGEVFLSLGKEGSTIGGLLGTNAKLLSRLLQYGARLPELVEDFSGVTFEPSGETDNPVIPSCTSLVDYVFQYLGSIGLDAVAHAKLGIRSEGAKEVLTRVLDHEEGNGNGTLTEADISALIRLSNNDGLPCIGCGRSGDIFRDTGSCLTCVKCKTAQGGCEVARPI